MQAAPLFIRQEGLVIVERKKHEILGLCLLVVTLLILLSLLSFDVTDLTLLGASAADRSPQNWIGSFGANLSWILIFSIGIGAYWLPVVGSWLSWSFLRGTNPFPREKLQVLGLGMLVLSSITLAALVSPTMHLWSQEIFTGGKVGQLLSSFLTARLNSIGTTILVVGIFFCGLLLATPFSLESLTAATKSLLASALHWLKDRREQRTDHNNATPLVGQPQPRSTPKETAPLRIFPAVELLPAPTSLQATANTGTLSTRTASQTPGSYHLPPLELLDVYELGPQGQDPKTLEHNAQILKEKLSDFGVEGEVDSICPGPVITMYEYVPAPGIKISRIVGLADDLSMALKAISIRVVAPIPGKAAIGIEIPNEHRQLVHLKQVLETEAFATSSTPLAIALGKDITGHPVIANLAKMPHLLVAGATGTGKSVCINALLSSLLYRNTPRELRLLLIDPKRIELSSYEGIPHLLHPVVTDAKMATRALRWAVQEMELRYKLLADKGVRNIEGYNKLLARESRAKDSSDNRQPAETQQEAGLQHHHLPFIVLFIDELADLMMVASREVEESIIRLAQMARAAGIHLVLATQRPSVDVLTGIIKANIPTRISFQVSSRTDSRTILDANGAESLLGSGDMLFLPPGTAKLQRIHGAYVSETEVQRLTQFWRDQQLLEDPLLERVNFEEQGRQDDISEDELDEKYEQAIELVLETRQASISMLQRRLRVGYNRAARMIEIMEQQGLVGPSDGVKPREVLISSKPN